MSHLKECEEGNHEYRYITEVGQHGLLFHCIYCLCIEITYYKDQDIEDNK